MSDVLKKVSGMLEISAGTELSLARRLVYPMCTREHCTSFGPPSPGFPINGPVARELYCLRIKTGYETHNDGSLTVYLNSKEVANKADWGKGSYVYDACSVDQISSVRVDSESTNAWTGSIAASTDGGNNYYALKCPTCGGSTFTANIVVDGDGNSAAQASATCLNTKKTNGCSLLLTSEHNKEPATTTTTPAPLTACQKRKALCRIPKSYWVLTYRFDANLLGFKKTFQGQVGGSQSKLSSCTSIAKCLWDRITNGYSFSSIVASFLNGAQGFLTKIDEAWGSSKEKVEAAFEKLVSTTTNWASDVFDSAMNGLSDLAKKFGDTASDAARKALKEGEKLLESAGAGLQKALGGLSSLMNFRQASCKKATAKVATLKLAWEKADKAHEDLVAKHLLAREAAQVRYYYT
jgi:hypothetical protein